MLPLNLWMVAAFGAQGVTQVGKETRISKRIDQLLDIYVCVCMYVYIYIFFQSCAMLAKMVEADVESTMVESSANGKSPVELRDEEVLAQKEMEETNKNKMETEAIKENNETEGEDEKETVIANDEASDMENGAQNDTEKDEKQEIMGTLDLRRECQAN
eukprot:Gb_26845 [translate_table: standard]